jgi:alpha-N-arabinofuranosidase
LNRHLTEEMELRVDLRGMERGHRLVETVELHHDDMNASNTQLSPDTVRPRPHERAQVEQDGLLARLKPGSWNVFVLEGETR